MLNIVKKINKFQIKQLVIYGIVGVSAAALAAISYIIFCKVMEPLLANFLSNCCGMVVSYFGHTKFTFQKTHRFSPSEFIKFSITSLIGLASNSLWIFILVHIYKFNPEVGIYPIIFFTPMLTFLISKFWAFK